MHKKALIKVLIIENERIAAEQLNANLGKLGYKVASICHTFKDAINCIIRNNVDLILLDHDLDGMHQNESGLALAQLINNTHKIPYLFLTNEDSGIGQIETEHGIYYSVGKLADAPILAEAIEKTMMVDY